MTNNAVSRMPARYAAVHTNGPTMPGDPTTIGVNDLINLTTTGTIGTLTDWPGMAGMQQNINGYTVQIFAVDPNAITQNPAVAIPNQSNGGAWNTAAYGQQIAVMVTGNYQPVWSCPVLAFIDSRSSDRHGQ